MSEHEEGVEKTSNWAEGPDKRLRKTSFWHDVAKAVTTPGVITALVTTVVGSLAVAIVTNRVTRALGEKEIQFKVVESLIKYTQEKDLSAGLEISKLDALTRLIADNEQFSIKVDGFQELVGKLREDKLEEARKTALTLEGEKRKLESELEKSLTGSAEDVERSRQLQADISTKALEIASAKQRAEELSSQLERGARERDDIAAQLRTVTSTLQQVRADLGAERSKTRTLTTILNEEHRIDITVETPDNDNDASISLIFSESPGCNENESVRGDNYREFTVDTRHKVPTSVTRFVKDVRFLDSKYFKVKNYLINGWSGKIYIRLDGELKLEKQVALLDADQAGPRCRLYPL